MSIAHGAQISTDKLVFLYSFGSPRAEVNSTTIRNLVDYDNSQWQMTVTAGQIDYTEGSITLPAGGSWGTPTFAGGLGAVLDPTNFSMGVWIKPNNMADVGNDSGHILYFNGYTMYHRSNYRIYFGGYTDAATPADTYNSGNADTSWYGSVYVYQDGFVNDAWSFFVGVKEGQELRAYMNGVRTRTRSSAYVNPFGDDFNVDYGAQTSLALSTSAWDDSQKLGMGFGYNRALSDAEVLDIYNQTKGIYT